MADAVQLTVANGIARVAFSRPEVLNAFNDAVALDFIAHMNAIEADGSVRCVVLEGGRRSFLRRRRHQDVQRHDYLDGRAAVPPLPNVS